MVSIPCISHICRTLAIMVSAAAQAAIANAKTLLQRAKGSKDSQAGKPESEVVSWVHQKGILLNI